MKKIVFLLCIVLQLIFPVSVTGQGEAQEDPFANLPFVKEQYARTIRLIMNGPMPFDTVSELHVNKKGIINVTDTSLNLTLVISGPDTNKVIKQFLERYANRENTLLLGKGGIVLATKDTIDGWEFLYVYPLDLKIVKNSVTLVYSGSQEFDGKRADTLHLSFRNNQKLDSLIVVSRKPMRLEFARPVPDYSKNDTILWVIDPYRTPVFPITLHYDRLDHSFADFTPETTWFEDLQAFNKQIGFYPSPHAISILLTIIPLIWMLGLIRFRKRLFDEIDPSFTSNIKAILPYFIPVFIFCFIASALQNVDWMLQGWGTYLEPTAKNTRFWKYYGVIIAIAAILVITGYFLKLKNVQVTYYTKLVLRSLGFGILLFVLYGIIHHFLVVNIPNFTYEPDSHFSLIFYSEYSLILILPIIIPFTFLAVKLFSLKKQLKRFKFIGLVIGFIISAIDITFIFTLFDDNPKVRFYSTPETAFSGLAKLTYLFPAIFILLYLTTIETKLASFYKLSRIRMYYLFALLLFACYVINFKGTFLLIPIPFILSVFLFRWVLMYSQREALNIHQLSEDVYTDRKKWIDYYLKAVELKQLRRIKEKYRKKFLSGDMLVSDYQKAVNETDEYIAGIDKEYKISSLDRGLSFGPHKDHWNNGVHGAAYGALISFPFVLLYYGKLFSDSGMFGFTILGLLSEVGMPIIIYLLGGFFFGFFFPFIRGNSGWKKGIIYGVVIALCNIPLGILSAEKLTIGVILLPLAQQVFTYTLLGFIFFDVYTIRKGFGKDFTWNMVRRIEGVGNIVALSSIVLSLITAALGAWFSGSISAAIQALTSGQFDFSGVMQTNY